MKGTHALKITTFILTLTLILLTACSGGSANPTATPAASGAATPVEAVKGFFAAVYGGEDTGALVCSTPDVADPFRIAAAASAALQGATIDISGLTYTVKDQTDASATVTVAGQIITRVLTNQSSADFPATDISVVNQGGWKFCGAADLG